MNGEQLPVIQEAGVQEESKKLLELLLKAKAGDPQARQMLAALMTRQSDVDPHNSDLRRSGGLEAMLTQQSDVDPRFGINQMAQAQTQRQAPDDRQARQVLAALTRQSDVDPHSGGIAQDELWGNFD